MKIIPAIDLMNGEVVRLFKGDPNQKTVYSNNPVEIAKKWEEFWCRHVTSCRSRRNTWTR